MRVGYLPLMAVLVTFVSAVAGCSGEKEEASGRATVEVDGKKFDFLQSESPSGQFTCDLSADEVRVEFEADSHVLKLEGTNRETGWNGQVLVDPRGSDRRYLSEPELDGGVFTVDGKSVVYTARFSYNPHADPTHYDDAGLGRIDVTCP